jgi:hypothetical protein
VLLRSDGTFDRASKVSLQPVEGAYVFEMSKLPDGSTDRHPGHKVSEIFTEAPETDQSRATEIQQPDPEHTKNPEKNSYEGGWGFFDEGNSLNPKEYQITADDDLWVANYLETSDDYHPTQEKEKPSILFIVITVVLAIALICSIILIKNYIVSGILGVALIANIVFYVINNNKQKVNKAKLREKINQEKQYKREKLENQKQQDT